MKRHHPNHIGISHALCPSSGSQSTLPQSEYHQLIEWRYNFAFFFKQIKIFNMFRKWSIIFVCGILHMCTYGKMVCKETTIQNDYFCFVFNCKKKFSKWLLLNISFKLPKPINKWDNLGINTAMWIFPFSVQTFHIQYPTRLLSHCQVIICNNKFERYHRKQRMTLQTKKLPPTKRTKASQSLIWLNFGLSRATTQKKSCWQYWNKKRPW